MSGGGVAGGAPTGDGPSGGAPIGNAPSGGPTSGGPTGGGISYDLPTAPYYEDPQAGTSHSSPQSTAPYGPFRNEAVSTPTYDPFDFNASSYSGRRIEPSPPAAPSRLLIGVVAGLVAGLLVFGAGGWFAGRATAPKATPKASPTASLGVFERSQVALNRPHFAAALLPMAQGWLPYLSSCSRNGEPGGPKLNAGEAARVRCTLDGMSAIFVEYKSVAGRDKTRAATLKQGADASILTPGIDPATQRRAPSGRTAGNYVEYGYSVTEGGTVRPVAGIWWDDTRTPVAAYLLAYWKEGVGQNWAPMRDLWSRYA